MNEDLATRVNDLFAKKPLEDKMKAIVGKCKAPENCDMLCVPRLDEALWSDLEKPAKSRDLALQNVHKCMLNSARPLIQMIKVSCKNKTPIDSKLLSECLR